MLLRLTEPFIKKLSLKENVLSPFPFVGSAEGLVQRAKAGLNEVESLHSIGTKANSGARM